MAKKSSRKRHKSTTPAQGTFTSSPNQPESDSDSDSLQELREILKTFPDELVIEILTWLPVKSILRFRCVSKSWLSLLSSANFIKAHIHNSSSNKDYAHHRLIVLNVEYGAYIKQCSLHSALCLPILKATNVYPTTKGNQVFSIVGSCNGLICVSFRTGEVNLWNPAIRKTKTLPKFGIRIQGIWRRCLISHGFGYDELNDDYKVVGIYTVWRFDGVETQVKVYSLKTDCWRRVEDPEGLVCLEEGHSANGKLANGKLHWISRKSFDTGPKIVRIDLSNESFAEVEKPDYEERTSYWTLEVLGGCLSLLGHYVSHADAWIMKEYGVRDSWTKMATLPCYSSPRDNAFCTPLFVSKEGQILFQFGEIMVRYNPQNRSVTFLKIFNPGALQGVNVYVESLVLPDSPAGEYHPH